MSEKRQHFLKQYDWIRKGLMFEPRGHDMMSGSIFYPPSNPENDIGILFIETSGCLPMCGHGTIGSITIGIQEGLIHPKIPGKVRLETPAGLVLIDYEMNGDKVAWVKLTNVMSYLAATDLSVTHPVLGDLKVDVAYGGNFYIIVDPQENFKGLEHYSASALISLSSRLRTIVNDQFPHQFIHPKTAVLGARVMCCGQEPHWMQKQRQGMRCFTEIKLLIGRLVGLGRRPEWPNGMPKVF